MYAFKIRKTFYWKRFSFTCFDLIKTSSLRNFSYPIIIDKINVSYSPTENIIKHYVNRALLSFYLTEF